MGNQQQGPPSKVQTSIMDFETSNLGQRALRDPLARQAWQQMLGWWQRGLWDPRVEDLNRQETVYYYLFLVTEMASWIYDQLVKLRQDASSEEVQEATRMGLWHLEQLSEIAFDDIVVDEGPGEPLIAYEQEDYDGDQDWVRDDSGQRFHIWSPDPDERMGYHQTFRLQEENQEKYRKQYIVHRIRYLAACKGNPNNVVWRRDPDPDDQDPGMQFYNALQNLQNTPMGMFLS